MTNETESLVLEILRSLRDDIAKLSARVDNLTAELRIVKQHVAALVQAELHRDDLFAAIEVRLDRIEKRLELTG